MMRRGILIGSACFLLGAISIALAQTAMTPDKFISFPWTWTGVQTFANGKLSLAGATSGNSLLQAPATGGGTVTLPTGTGTLSFSAGGGVDPASANTWSGVQTFNDTKLALAGATSGTSVLKAPATGGGTVTLPTGTGTLAFSAGGGTPGGSSGQIQYNNAGAFGGFTMAGDCTFAQPNITCTKTGGITFGTAATVNTGTSGATIPVLNAANTWAGTQTFGSVVGGVNSQSGTTYTLAATDCGKTVVMTNAAAVTVTTLNSLPVGCGIAVEQAGAGQVTVANGSGATLSSFDAFTKTAGQWAIIGLFVDTNAGGSAAHYVLTGRGA